MRKQASARTSPALRLDVTYFTETIVQRGDFFAHPRYDELRGRLHYASFKLAQCNRWADIMAQAEDDARKASYARAGKTMSAAERAEKKQLEYTADELLKALEASEKDLQTARDALLLEARREPV